MDSKYQEQLELVKRLGLSAAQQIILDLSVAKVDAEYNLGGNFFYVKDAPDENSYVDVKVNGSNNQAVSWTKQTGFIQPFNRLYITTPAGQTGQIKILIAAEAPDLFDIVDNRSAMSQNLADVLTELRGDTTPKNWGRVNVGTSQVELLEANTNRKSCSFCADVDNLGYIYLGFDNTVTSSKWFHVLVAGGSYHIDDYRGPVHAIASLANQKIGKSEV